MEAIFTLARKLSPAIIFIDEIDSFLRSRTAMDQESAALVKAQFMTFWDGFEKDLQSQVVVVGATNRYCPPRDPAAFSRSPTDPMTLIAPSLGDSHVAATWACR